MRDAGELRWESLAIPADGGAERSVLPGTSSQGFSEVSPDGRWVVYQSNETGRWEVYVRPYPDTERAKRQVSRAGGVRPSWSSDGSELYFLSPNLDLYGAPVETGAIFRSGPPELLVSRRDMIRTGDGTYAVHPDGSRFLVPTVAEGDARQGRIVMVENFVRELEERFARPGG